MKFLIAVMAMMFTMVSFAQDEVAPTSVSVKCDWGTLTMEAIRGGLDMGPHSVDPSGDGKNKNETLTIPELDWATL
jgi:hypothetical protein